MSSQTIATILIGLLLLSSGLARHFPKWTTVAAGAMLFALLTLAVTHMVGSPLRPEFAAAGPANRLWQQSIVSMWWLFAAYLLVELARIVLLYQGFSREGRLFSDLLAGVVYLGVVFTIVSIVFSLPIGGLVATSGIIAIVLGLALQNTLADVFAGIAVGIERPYMIGDQIWLEGPIEGEVTQINWRSVQIRTSGNDIATVPNSLVAKSRIINRNAPSPQRSDGMRLPCNAGIEPRQVIELIYRAILLCPQIMEIPMPSVRLTRVGRRSNEYDINFSVASSGLLRDAKDALLQQFLRQLRPVGVFAQDASAVSVEHLVDSASSMRPSLSRIALFQDLPSAARDRLGEQLIRHVLEPRQVLFSQGDAEASLFIVGSGVLEVCRMIDGAFFRVGRITVGDYIGEIGMLTGAPHAASVTALTPCTVFELCKNQVAPLLTEQPDLMHAFELSARRGQALIDRSVAASVGATVVPHGPLLDRIRAFFHAKV